MLCFDKVEEYGVCPIISMHFYFEVIETNFIYILGSLQTKNNEQFPLKVFFF